MNQKDFILALDKTNEKIDRISKRDAKAHKKNLAALRSFNREMGFHGKRA